MFKSIRSLLHMLSLPKPDYEFYCREKRLERYKKNDGGDIKYLHLHSIIHRILMPLMKCELYLFGKRLVILRDNRKKTNSPIIFCPTHIGGVDIEMSFLAIHSPCWVALGWPRELYKSINGMMTQMNGWIPFDIDHKDDRIAAKAQMQALLKKGGNLLLFPEGIQNISPNALIGHLYAGAVDLAITYGAEIIPVAIGRNEEKYFFIIGENISYENYTYDDRYRLTEELRNHLATLKWEIIEKLPTIKREDIDETTYNQYLKCITTFNTKHTLTIDDIHAAMFHPKNVTEPEIVFRHLTNISPKPETAFLFNTRLTGYYFQSKNKHRNL